MNNQEMLDKIEALEHRVLMLERSALAQRIDFTPRPLTEDEETARNLGVPAYIIEMLPIFKALLFIQEQYRKGQLRFVSSSADQRVPLGKLEQLVLHFGGTYRSRATLGQLRTVTDVPFATASGRVQVADFNLARLRSVNKGAVYQVRFHTRTVALDDVALAVLKLREIFATLPQITKDMLAIDKRNHELTWEKEHGEITREIMNSESRKTSRFIRKDTTLNITCSPQARELVLPSWAIPSDIEVRVDGVMNSPIDEDLTGSIETQEEQLELDTNSVHQWWLDKGVELNEDLMPQTVKLYPNPREVMRKYNDVTESLDINPDTGRSYIEDGQMLQMIIAGQLPDALPKGESFDELPSID